MTGSLYAIEAYLSHSRKISLKESFSDCKGMFLDDIPSFFQLLEQHFNITQFFPALFIMLSINILIEKEIILLPDFFLP